MSICLYSNTILILKLSLSVFIIIIYSKGIQLTLYNYTNIDYLGKLF